MRQWLAEWEILMLIQTGHFCGTENNKNAKGELSSANIEEQTSEKFGNI